MIFRPLQIQMRWSNDGGAISAQIKVFIWIKLRVDLENHDSSNRNIFLDDIQLGLTFCGIEWLWIAVCLQYVNHKSTMQFPLLLSLSLSLFLYFLSFHFTHFTHIPGHRLLKRLNLKSCLAYFTSPTCFLYPVLWCCWKDVSLTLHGDACGCTGLCLYTCIMYVQVVCT